MMLVALFLILAATLFRVMPPVLNVHHDWMSNFSPMASIVLCGAIFFPKRLAVWIPLVVLAVSDFVLNRFVYHFPLISWDILPRYAVFLVIGALVFRYRSSLRDKPFVSLGTCFAASLLYYLTTNSASWIGEVGYTKNLAGWWQAMTMGLPDYPSTILFFRNSVISDLLFTGLFFVCMAATSRKKAEIEKAVCASIPAVGAKSSI